VAQWIGEHTPGTSGYLEPAASPEYSVLSDWTDGHILEYVARRPTVTNNFGDDIGEENMELAEAYYRAPEPEAVRLLERLGARYVVHEGRRVRTRWEAGPDSMLSRLYFFDGQEGRRSVAIRAGLAQEVRFAAEAVRHHRLVFETGQAPYPAKGMRPAFKVYEYVPGALVSGRALPGSRVKARISIETQTGRRFDFVSSTRTDAAGRYELRLPYANTSVPGYVRTGSYYELSAEGVVTRLRVEEAAVLHGREMPGPDLAPERPSSPLGRLPAALRPAP
jgi:dolichyl-diphosphooligosaccharide--protein glycosyltransferase